MAVPVAPQDQAERAPMDRPGSTALRWLRTEPSAAQAFAVATVATEATAASAARAPAGPAVMGSAAKAVGAVVAVSAVMAARAGMPPPTLLAHPVPAAAMPGTAGAAATVVVEVLAALVHQKGPTDRAARPVMAEMPVALATVPPEQPAHMAPMDHATAPLALTAVQAATAEWAATAV